MDGLVPSIHANRSSRGFALSAAINRTAWVAATDPRIKSGGGHDVFGILSKSANVADATRVL
jgi:hypothetical protein